MDCTARGTTVIIQLASGITQARDYPQTQVVSQAPSSQFWGLLAGSRGPCSSLWEGALISCPG